MDWPDFPVRDPVPVDLEVDIAVEWQQSRGQRPTVLIQATHASQGIGQCLVRSAGEYSRASVVQDWAFVDWLGVQEPYRGIGLGKHLLQRGLNEMRGVGYRHASISTAWDNYRAYVLYTHFGFKVVDWTYGYRHEIGS